MITITASTLQTFIEISATCAFALSGLITSAQKRLDAFGVVVVTGVTAFGGGTLRDVLLDRRPFFWVEHAHWLWLILLMCILAMMFMRRRHIQPTARAIRIPDALGLGLFTALGTQMALDLHLPAIICVLMGVMTTVFGGVLRDIFCNEIPKAFTDHQPYAVIAFTGSLFVVGLNQLGYSPSLCIFIPASWIFIIRLIVLHRDWRLPSWKIHLEDGE